MAAAMRCTSPSRMMTAGRGAGSRKSILTIDGTAIRPVPGIAALHIRLVHLPPTVKSLSWPDRVMAAAIRS